MDVGSVVNGKYRLVRLLGDGGMGSVYEAIHAVLGTRVAIKVLHPELARRTGLVERFLQEARVAAQIRSPNVVQVTDVDRTAEGQAYIVMELLEGEALSSVLDRQRKLPVTIAGEYTRQILVALEAAHALGVIHRDLKPENVFVTFAGGRPVLKLIDFGIAKARPIDPQQRNLTVAGVVMGTAEYMAPEQARSADKVDGRADLYAVGVMLYEMIAGARPVVGDDARIIALKVERGEVVPLVTAAPDAPREVAGLVHRAMAARPELRFATATAMRLALEAAMSPRRPALSGSGAPAAGMPAPLPTLDVALASLAPPERTPTGTLRNEVVPPWLETTGSRESDAPVQTVRAPPIATALVGPPPANGAALPAAPAAGRHRRAGRTGPRTAALIALPLVLGAGLVGVLVATGTWAPNAAPTAPLSLGPTSGVDAGAGIAAGDPASAVASPKTPPAEIPTLLSNKPAPAPLAPPRSPPTGSHTPGSGADASGELPPPFIFPSALPSALPSFPSSLPLPKGFPTSLGSGLPVWPTTPLDPGVSPGSAPAPAAPPSSRPPRPTAPPRGGMNL